jgi:hypothetical protein
MHSVGRKYNVFLLNVMIHKVTSFDFKEINVAPRIVTALSHLKR